MATEVDDASLSQLWREMTERYLPRSGCRLIVQEDDIPEGALYSTVAELLLPLREEMSEATKDRPDWRDIPPHVAASVVIGARMAVAQHHWAWPVRLDIDAGLVVTRDDLKVLGRGLARQEAASGDIHMGVGIADPDLATRWGLDLRVAPHDVDTAPVWRDEVAANQEKLRNLRRPLCLLPFDETQLSPAFVDIFVYNLSHNAPPDVRFLMPVTDFRRSPRSRRFCTPQRSASRRKWQRDKLESRVIEMAAELSVISDPVWLAMPVQVPAEALGIHAGTMQLGRFRDALVDALLKGQVRYGNESDTGETLPRIKAQTDQLIADHGRTTGTPPETMEEALNRLRAMVVRHEAPWAPCRPLIRRRARRGLPRPRPMIPQIHPKGCLGFGGRVVVTIPQTLPHGRNGR